MYALELQVMLMLWVASEYEMDCYVSNLWFFSLVSATEWVKGKQMEEVLTIKNTWVLVIVSSYIYIYIYTFFSLLILLEHAFYTIVWMYLANSIICQSSLLHNIEFLWLGEGGIEYKSYSGFLHKCFAQLAVDSFTFSECLFDIFAGKLQSIFHSLQLSYTAACLPRMLSRQLLKTTKLNVVPTQMPVQRHHL